VFNAVAFIRHVIYAHLPAEHTATVLKNHSRSYFDSLHGNATTDAEQNVVMRFSLWDLDPEDGLFHPALEQASPPDSQLTAVSQRAIHWPGNGHAPPADFCAFTDCSTSNVHVVDAHKQYTVQFLYTTPSAFISVLILFCQSVVSAYMYFG